MTTEEFRGQDARYGKDSYFGRELLFLAANNEWTRATRETIDITRSDSVDTQITIQVDLDKITHEALRHRTGPIWLPLLILSGPTREPPGEGSPSGSRSWPLGRSPGRRPKPAAIATAAIESDPFASLSVADAQGRLLAPLPNADVWHRLSAALAEIFINIAVASWSGPDHERPTSTRDQRLLLAAAIYRFLRDRSEPSAPVDAEHAGHAPATGTFSGRIGTAKERVSRLLAHYIDEYEDHHCRASAGQPRVPAPGDQAAGMLIQHAIEVLHALAGAVVVVVATVVPVAAVVPVPVAAVLAGLAAIVTAVEAVLRGTAAGVAGHDAVRAERHGARSVV